MAVISKISSAFDSGGADAPDFSSLSPWEAWAQDEFATTPDEYIAEIYNDFGGPLYGYTRISGWGSTTPTNHATIRSAAGHGHGGVVGGGAILSNTLDVHTLKFEDNYIVVEDLEVRGEGIGSSVNPFYITESNATVRNCICYVVNDSQSTAFRLSESDNTVLENILIIHGASGSTGGWGAWIPGSNAASVSNITIVRPNGGTAGVGVGGNPGSDLINIVVWNFGGDDWASSTNLTNCADSDGSGSGINHVTGITGEDFVNAAGLQFTPATLGKLDGAGANLSADFTDDITGYTRPGLPDPWEIGAYEIQGGVVPTPPTNVEAGGAYSGTVGTPIAIDGASFTPGTGSPDVILWTFIGPGGTWDDDSILSPTFTPDGVDTYVLTLTITNDAGSDADTASLTATAATLNEMYIKDGGTFKQATPYIKEGGVFVAADAYVRSGGAWVKVQDK